MPALQSVGTLDSSPVGMKPSATRARPFLGRGDSHHPRVVKVPIVPQCPTGSRVRATERGQTRHSFVRGTSTILGWRKSSHFPQGKWRGNSILSSHWSELCFLPPLRGGRSSSPFSGRVSQLTAGSILRISSSPSFQPQRLNEKGLSTPPPEGSGKNEYALHPEGHTSQVCQIWSTVPGPEI